MIDRDILILYGSYERAFFGKAISDGLVKPVNVQQDLLDFDELTKWKYDLTYKHNPHKTAVLQMFLLFDKLLLVDSDIGYDLDPLKRTGLIEVVTINEEPSLLGDVEKDPATKEYALFLKPIVLNHLMKTMTPNVRVDMRSHGIRPHVFYSVIYDLLFSNKPPTTSDEIHQSTIWNYIQKRAEHYYLKHEAGWNSILFPKRWQLNSFELFGGLKSKQLLAD